jgi:S-disulfanyl-L-cysteine oxidoreductase SoxD
VTQLTRRVAIALVGVVAAAACKLDARDDYLGDKDPKRFALGHAPAPTALATEDIDVNASGAGLPAGSGTAAQGAAVYATNCATCHGNDGEGKPPYPQLLGGPRGNVDFSTDAKIPRTIGNYWPYATTLFDYIRRAMPLTSPGILTPDQTYAVTAYLLSRDGVIPPTAQLDARTLPAVQMPARPRFVNDDRRGSIGGKNVR